MRLDDAALQSKSASMRLAARVRTSKPNDIYFMGYTNEVRGIYVRIRLQVSGVSGTLHSYYIPSDLYTKWWLSYQRARLSGFSGGRRSWKLFLLRPE